MLFTVQQQSQNAVATLAAVLGRAVVHRRPHRVRVRVFGRGAVGGHAA